MNPTFDSLMWDISSANVIDLGCGTGHFTYKLKERTKGKVYALDVSAGMLE